MKRKERKFEKERKKIRKGKKENSKRKERKFERKERKFEQEKFRKGKRENSKRKETKEQNLNKAVYDSITRVRWAGAVMEDTAGAYGKGGHGRRTINSIKL